jgi:hypothetical protein
VSPARYRKDPELARPGGRNPGGLGFEEGRSFTIGKQQQDGRLSCQVCECTDTTCPGAWSASGFGFSNVGAFRLTTAAESRVIQDWRIARAGICLDR